MDHSCRTFDNSCSDFYIPGEQHHKLSLAYSPDCNSPGAANLPDFRDRVCRSKIPENPLFRSCSFNLYRCQQFLRTGSSSSLNSIRDGVRGCTRNRCGSACGSACDAFPCENHGKEQGKIQILRRLDKEKEAKRRKQKRKRN